MQVGKMRLKGLVSGIETFSVARKPILHALPQARDFIGKLLGREGPSGEDLGDQRRRGAKPRILRIDEVRRDRQVYSTRPAQSSKP